MEYIGCGELPRWTKCACTRIVPSIPNGHQGSLGHLKASESDGPLHNIRRWIDLDQYFAWPECALFPWPYGENNSRTALRTSTDYKLKVPPRASRSCRVVQGLRFLEYLLRVKARSRYTLIYPCGRRRMNQCNRRPVRARDLAPKAVFRTCVSLSRGYSQLEAPLLTRLFLDGPPRFLRRDCHRTQRQEGSVDVSWALRPSRSAIISESTGIIHAPDRHNLAALTLAGSAQPSAG